MAYGPAWPLVVFFGVPFLLVTIFIAFVGSKVGRDNGEDPRVKWRKFFTASGVAVALFLAALLASL